MPKKITGEEILIALKRDPRYAEMTEETFSILIPFVLKAPEIFGQNLLSSKASVAKFLQAKIVFMNYCLQNGLAEKSAQLLISSFHKVTSALKIVVKNKKVPALPPTAILEEKIKLALSTLIGAYRVTLEKLPQLQQTGNAQLLVLTQAGMTEATAHKVLADNLTIADLLLLEPGAVLILGNSKK